MKLTILGSGTCVPTIKRASPANYLKVGETNILVDCGSGTLRQIVKAKLDYKDIDYLFLTHFHPDHMADFIVLIQALNWTPNFTRKKDLTVVGPIGLKNFFELHLKPIPGIIKINASYKIIIKEIKDKLSFNNFQVECVKTIHSDKSIAYKFIKKGKAVVISGDCDYDKKLVNFCKKVDLLLVECSFPNESKKKGHLIPKECGQMAKIAKVKKMILTHLYPMVKETRLEQTREIFENTILAKDLMEVEI
jgi:ribonuclease BN (tRNA processing enzyme)